MAPASQNGAMRAIELKTALPDARRRIIAIGARARHRPIIPLLDRLTILLLKTRGYTRDYRNYREECASSIYRRPVEISY